MAQQFYTLLTNIGKAKLTNANVFGKKINLTTLVVGDGNGNYYNPTEDQEKLVSEVWRGNIQLITVDEQNPNWIKIETVIPSNVGGFTIREVGGIDDEGNLILIAKYPETYKPIIDDGATKELRIKIILEVSNTENVTLKVNPNVITATKEDIENLKNKINNLDGKAVTLRSYSKLEKDTKIIPINIPEFNPLNEDDLEVHMNGRLLTKDVNYKIASSNTDIENIDEEILWQTGDEFDIALHKNIKNKVEHIDVGLIPKGSITEDKLNPQIVEKVKEVSDKLPKSDFNNFRKDYVSNNGFAKTTGTSTIYNVTLNPAPTSYVDGFNITIIPHTDCGDSPKLNINGLGVTTILNQDGNSIKAGEIKANKPLSLVRVGSNFFMKSSGRGNLNIKRILNIPFKFPSDTAFYVVANIPEYDVVNSFINVSANTDSTSHDGGMPIAYSSSKTSVALSRDAKSSTCEGFIRIIEFEGHKAIYKSNTIEVPYRETHKEVLNGIKSNKCLILKTCYATTTNYASGTLPIREEFIKEDDSVYMKLLLTASTDYYGKNTYKGRYTIVELY